MITTDLSREWYSSLPEIPSWRSTKAILHYFRKNPEPKKGVQVLPIKEIGEPQWVLLLLFLRQHLTV
jgi:hypothetical protein